MGQIFPRNANLLARLSIFAAVLLIVELLLITTVYFRSNYYRQINVAIQQPVPYSHQLHAGTLGIDCRYCHVSVDKSYFANIPATEICMTCHSQIRTGSAKLTVVRDSYATGQPVLWQKVNRVPSFVYFNHSIHINKGVGCAECHGKINEMPVVWQPQAFFMGFCLNCHRNPEKFLRPLDQVFNLNYVHPANQTELGLQLMKQYGVMPKTQLQNCWVCHR